MRVFIFLAGLAALLALSVGPQPAAAAEEVGEEAVWSLGMVTDYLEGQSITLTVPGENEGEEESLTLTITEETEFYETIEVGSKVEVEHKGGQALYVQKAEEG